MKVFKMDIISNSSPIIFLSKIGMLDLLVKLFDNIYIPDAVYDEVSLSDKDDNVSRLIKEKVDLGQIKKFKVKNIVAVRALLGRLHQGEVEVIIGANEMKIKMVILDDLYARNKATQLDLDVTGTIGILLLAYRNGLISNLELELQKLISIGCRISDTLMQQILKDIVINKD
jgi:predicted nucleic acid-binding protein